MLEFLFTQWFASLVDSFMFYQVAIQLEILVKILPNEVQNMWLRTFNNIQLQSGDVDNPVFCNCTGFSFLNGDEQSEGFGRSVCLSPLDEANSGNNLMTKLTKDEIKSFFKIF